jgi:hypothetical protein
VLRRVNRHERAGPSGPGLQLGYQFTADQGFTVLTSWGAGLEFSDGDVTRWPLLNLGFGYTWRRGSF